MSDAWKSLVRQSLRGAPAYHVPTHPNAIKLDANESPYPLSRAAMEAVARELGLLEVHRYPDAGALLLRQTLAARLGVAEHWVYAPLYNGRIAVARDAATGLYLFADDAPTMEQLLRLTAGDLQTVRL